MKLSWGWGVNELQKRLAAQGNVKVLVRYAEAEYESESGRYVPAREESSEATLATVTSLECLGPCFHAATDLGKITLTRGDWLVFAVDES